MKSTFPDLNLSSNSTASTTEGACYSAEKLSGYNEGFQEALSTLDQVIWVIFISQFIQVFTHRILTQQYPFQIEIKDKKYGSKYQLGDTAVSIISYIDGVAFTASLTLSAFLFVQVVGVPAYDFEVRKVFP